MRLGVLNYEESVSEENRGCLGALLAVIAFVALMVGFFWDISSDVVDTTWPHRILLVGVVSAIGFLLTLGKGKHWRAGNRLCSGVLWDSERGEELTDSFFHLKIDSRPKGGSPDILKRQTVLEFTPCADPRRKNIPWPKSIPWSKKKGLELSITLNSHETVGYHPGIGSPSGYNVGDVSFISMGVYDKRVHFEVLLDEEIAKLGGLWEGNGELFAMLRELGGWFAKLGPDRLKVRLVVNPPDPLVAKKRQGGLAGLATNPASGLVGGLMAAGSGVAPAVGVLASVVGQDAREANMHLTSPAQAQINAWQVRRMNILVYGGLGRPNSDSLKSIAEELGWEIVPPPGYRFVGVGNAERKEVSDSEVKADPEARRMDH